MKPFVLPGVKYPLKRRIFISFSGGKTSAYMTVMLLAYFRDHPEYEVVVFANTGQEHEETLLFVRDCEQYFGIEVVWVEAVVHPERGVATTHRRTWFDTACRDGEPFEAVVRKFGIPNKSYDHCTRELKLRPMHSFLRSIGWAKGTYSTAIGIRSDEMTRISMTRMVTDLIFYPCFDSGVDSAEVLDWHAKLPFHLNLPEHHGNCKWCWKKSNRKHLTLVKSNPEYFDFPRRMEQDYPFVAGPRRDGGTDIIARTFFRGNQSTDDLFRAAEKPFEPFIDGMFDDELNFIKKFDPDMDEGSSCSESCDVFGSEDFNPDDDL